MPAMISGCSQIETLLSVADLVSSAAAGGGPVHRGRAARTPLQLSIGTLAWDSRAATPLLTPESTSVFAPGEAIPKQDSSLPACWPVHARTPPTTPYYPSSFAAAPDPPMEDLFARSPEETAGLPSAAAFQTGLTNRPEPAPNPGAPKLFSVEAADRPLHDQSATRSTHHDRGDSQQPGEGGSGGSAQHTATASSNTGAAFIAGGATESESTPQTSQHCVSGVSAHGMTDGGEDAACGPTLPVADRRRQRNTRFAGCDARDASSRDDASDPGGDGDVARPQQIAGGGGAATTEGTRERLATSFTAAAMRADSHFGGSPSVLGGRSKSGAAAGARAKQLLVSGADRFPSLSGRDVSTSAAVTKVRRCSWHAVWGACCCAASCWPRAYAGPSGGLQVGQGHGHHDAYPCRWLWCATRQLVAGECWPSAKDSASIWTLRGLKQPPVKTSRHHPLRWALRALRAPHWDQ